MVETTMHGRIGGRKGCFNHNRGAYQQWCCWQCFWPQPADNTVVGIIGQARGNCRWLEQRLNWGFTLRLASIQPNPTIIGASSSFAWSFKAECGLTLIATCQKWSFPTLNFLVRSRVSLHVQEKEIFSFSSSLLFQTYHALGSWIPPFRL